MVAPSFFLMEQIVEDLTECALLPIVLAADPVNQELQKLVIGSTSKSNNSQLMLIFKAITR